MMSVWPAAMDDARNNGGPVVSLTRASLGRQLERTASAMLWTIIVILFALWVLGLVASIGGAAIHLLLVVAAFVLLAQLFTGRSTAH